ncbi:MAG: Uma2 family endonuclease [Solirubrobacteraceae bacterium]|nr:Uma2 family endonuclease [Solirubrobacteraceae bacterium]
MHTAARMTTREFLALPEPPAMLRFELLDGELVTHNGPAARHQMALVRLIVTFDAWCGAAPDRGRVLPDLAVEPSTDTVFLPDLQWWSAGRGPSADDGLPWPVGDIAIEIASPSTARFDAIVKTDRYLQAGAQEVWLVDPQRPGARIVRADVAGPPAELGPDDALTSPLLPGFALPLARLSD